jgi:hypothetical protein
VYCAELFDVSITELTWLVFSQVSLITALKDICEGKIYVEGEGARLTMMLAKIKEAQGDVTGACDTIQARFAIHAWSL